MDRLDAALAGRYSLQRELGRGGMATVYLAQDLRHDRPIALKVLHPELAATLGPERFQREIRVAAQLENATLYIEKSGCVALTEPLCCPYEMYDGCCYWFTNAPDRSRSDAGPRGP